MVILADHRHPCLNLSTAMSICHSGIGQTRLVSHHPSKQFKFLKAICRIIIVRSLAPARGRLAGEPTSGPIHSSTAASPSRRRGTSITNRPILVKRGCTACAIQRTGEEVCYICCPIPCVADTAVNPATPLGKVRAELGLSLIAAASSFILTWIV